MRYSCPSCGAATVTQFLVQADRCGSCGAGLRAEDVEIEAGPVAGVPFTPDDWRCTCGHEAIRHVYATDHPRGADPGFESCHPCLDCECGCYFPADDEDE